MTLDLDLTLTATIIYIIAMKVARRSWGGGRREVHVVSIIMIVWLSVAALEWQGRVKR